MLSIRDGVSRRSTDLSSMCWSCALRQQRSYNSLSRRANSLLNSSYARPSRAREVLGRPKPGQNTARQITASNSRPYKTSVRLLQQAEINNAHDSPVFNPALHSIDAEDTAWEKGKPLSNIRQQLKLWNAEHGQDQTLDFSESDDVNEFGEAGNNFTRLGDIDNFRRPRETEETARDEADQIARARADDLEDFDPQHRFLRKGDLVELEFPRSERESTLAVFVRRVGQSPPQAQFYTLNGKWIHLNEKQIQYAVHDWMDPDMIDPIVPYLPATEVTDELLDRAQMFDLSVPRDVSAPLVSRMLQFQRESDELYRNNASTLDSAHSLLAHPSDLKFGSLEQVAQKLLGKSNRDASLSAPALYTVRKALSRAGFAFGADRRSHRLTGFIQIRSKEQVANVEKVRNWIREWQDALAEGADSKRGPLFKHGGAKHVNDFVVKARQLIEGSRQTREATDSGRIAPSKKQFDIVGGQSATKFTHTVEFTNEDRELVRFMEGWACSNIFENLPRVSALPPLILQATGHYENYELAQKTGFMFLQEIGVLMPHENRVRFDQHLLLPSSQHSKPLENLMSTLLEMKDKPNFLDSMKGLRHDWGDMPVFCIDGEGAHEIDDGLSVEKAGDDEYWVHVHIANPTAFFNRENPLAKMARHMTETIYMPERAFMMLPRWATQAYFSLDKNRPCLTFSARMNLAGQTLEHKITPGLIRNVHHITPAEVSKVIGVYNASEKESVLAVGGGVPRKPAKKTAERLSTKDIEMLKIIQKLAEKRQAKRKAAGGLFLDSHHPEISIYNSPVSPGLGWEHPSRRAARYVEGEPVIEYRSNELISWFSAGEDISDILVREMMLLACEISAQWSAERNIPIIFRGTIPHPHAEDPDVYYREVLAPATEKNGGEAPMHLAIEYLRATGATVLSTSPKHHRVLGLPYYAKVTSPLRRYGDMILHWQIEAALREEARTKTSLIGSKREDYLPFSTSNLDQITTGLQPREMMIRRATQYAEDHWVAQLFFRAFHFGEAALPKTFSAYIFQRPQSQVSEIACRLKEYSLTCSMIRPETMALGEAKAGDWWECEIDHVDCYHRKVVVKPLRRTSRWED